MHLAELTSKIIAEIELVSQSHVHVGEHEPGSARLEVMRLYDGSFIVPSSTWKGCFRGLAEKLAPSLSLDDLEMLAVEAYGANGYVPKLGDERFRNYLEEMRDVLMGREKPTKIVKHGREELTLLLRDMGYEEIERGGGAVEKSLTDMALDYLALHCPIGRLFGNHVIASKLRFHHTVVGKEARTVETRPGVGIDRATGSVKENILFYVEALPVGSSFKLRFVADNLEPGASDSRLLAGVLDWVQIVGLQIGGRKSVGLGLVKPAESIFNLVQPKKDQGKKALANPIKHGEKLKLAEIISYLKKKE